MSSPPGKEASIGTLGFSFIMRANGLGGTFPKLYAANVIANRLMAQTLSEFVASPPNPSGWPSDPGDNVFPILQRDYGPGNGGVVNDGLCPNNVRLTQVPLSSVVASHGIGPSTNQKNVPSSTNFGVTSLETTPGAQNTIGNVGGIQQVRVSCVTPTNAVIFINGGEALGLLHLTSQDYNVSSLGNIQIVNLSAFEVTVGIVAQLSF